MVYAKLYTAYAASFYGQTEFISKITSLSNERGAFVCRCGADTNIDRQAKQTTDPHIECDRPGAVHLIICAAADAFLGADPSCFMRAFASLLLYRCGTWITINRV